MRREISVGLALVLTGLTLFLISSIPITRTDEVKNTSFTVSPGAKYGPYDDGTYHHTMVFGKSVLKGEIMVEGEDIYVTAGGYNVQDFKDLYIKGRYSFTISPAHDQYTFTFDNTEGTVECLVRFTLTEVWTASLSPLVWILGLVGLLLLVPIGLVILALTYFRFRRADNSHATARAILLFSRIFSDKCNISSTARAHINA